MLARYILSRVCACKSIVSITFHAIYLGLCVFRLPISLRVIMIICAFYLFINIESEVLDICHCLVLGHETMLCCMSFYIPIELHSLNRFFYLIIYEYIWSQTMWTYILSLVSWLKSIAFSFILKVRWLVALSASINCCICYSRDWLIFRE